ncbi:general secretion pathway protein GspK [Roseateles flavus]|uniref:T2SS protein K first SAM-like domain-containing protein n=1 Tax=Roseateles flavus TaxID=3149041 RepID=A0ABV0GAH1_9BURK
MKQRGFALAVVLWVLAGLAVVAATVASLTHDSAKSIQQLRQRVTTERAVIDTRARLSLLMATGAPTTHSYFSPGGVLFADGRPLAVTDGHAVEVQDLSGLVNLTKPEHRRLTQVLLACGAKEDQVASLIDALEDYQDVDHNKRLNGAEAQEYRDAKAPPPRDNPLMSADELWRVMGFGSIKASWEKARCGDLVTVHGEGIFNRNTAPAELLVADGMDLATARAYVQSRRDGLADPLSQERRSNDKSNIFAWEGTSYVGPVARVRHHLQSVEWCPSYVLELNTTQPGGPVLVKEPLAETCEPLKSKPLHSLPPPVFVRKDNDSNSPDAPPRLPFSLR